MSGMKEHIIDEILVMDVQNGSSEAFEALYGRWQRRIWSYIAGTTGNVHSTWDISQDVWMSILKGIQKLNDPARFKVWAYRIARNKAADWVKNKSKGRKVFDQVESLDLDTINPAVEDDDSRAVRELLERIEDKHREMIWLFYFEELSVSEISEILRIPSGTVKSRLFKAREEFKKVWETDFER